MSELVKVRVTVIKTDTYQKTVEMTKEEFQEWDRKLDSEDFKEVEHATDNISEFVDGYDVTDSITDSIDEFEIVKGDEDEG